MSGFLIPHDYVANRAMLGSDQQRCVECDEERDHAYHADLPPTQRIDAAIQQAVAKVHEEPVFDEGWIGNSPFWLKCETPSDGNVGIDVDQKGWMDEYYDLVRKPGTWFLMEKRRRRPLFVVLLEAGDELYFAKRHVGDVMTAQEIVAYGIGKKKPDGRLERLWLLPNGVACVNDDVDPLGARMLSRYGPV